jgi:nucleoside-triphosphatase THEP1
MKIIALTGDSSVGKTTTLNIVYDTLLNNGGVSTNKQRLGGDPLAMYII